MLQNMLLKTYAIVGIKVSVIRRTSDRAGFKKIKKQW